MSKKQNWELTSKELRMERLEKNNKTIQKANKQLEKVKMLSEGYLESIQIFMEEQKENLYLSSSKGRANSEKYRLLLVDEMKKLSDIIFEK
jgi:hypothetical protein